MLSEFESITDREAFFQIYLEKLMEAELVEDSYYLYFSGSGTRNRSIQIDGYAYDELDCKLTLFVIPPLSYYDEKTITSLEAESYFKKAKNFYFDVEKILTEVEESSEGFGLAFDIANEKMVVKILEIVLLCDTVKSKMINQIASVYEDKVRIDYSLYDISRMQQLDESKNGKEPVIIDLENFDSEKIYILPASKTEEYEAYLCNMPGRILANLYDKYQSRLLEGNVRSFLQTKGKINKGIRRTILNEPEMFFAYNNGIAATAESIEFIKNEHGQYISRIVGLQIVNGGQTTASLANSWINDNNRSSKDKINRIYVPMKISVVSFESAQELIPNISRYANSQNKVSDADLASNHPFHIRVEELSRRIISPATNGQQFGTFWYYERANGQYRQETYRASPSVKKNFELKSPKNQMFKKVDVAKYFNIYFQKPYTASAGAQKSFSDFSKWVIEQWDRNPNFVNEDFFKKLVSLCILFRESDKIVRKQTWYDSYKANIVAYTLSSIFHEIEVDFPDKDLDVLVIWKHQALTNGWVNQIIIVSKIMYEHLTNPNRDIENVTEWAKRKLCWEQAKLLDFHLDTEFLNELSDKEYLKTQEIAAIKEQKANNEMDALMTVFDYGNEFWKELFSWGEKEKIWNVQDRKFLEIAISIEKKVPSDRQAIKILQLLDKARYESFPK
ncbi:AIPR family protein [Listeria marthii]|nr:AIPR family protein [Listeria marthii]